MPKLPEDSPDKGGMMLDDKFLDVRMTLEEFIDMVAVFILVAGSYAWEKFLSIFMYMRMGIDAMFDEKKEKTKVKQ